MAFRAFVAVPVPALASLVALLDVLSRIRADVKPVEPTQLHFTLSFLGDVPEEAATPLAEAITEAARGVAAFDQPLRAVGAFPSASRPRVVWAGVSDPRPISDLALRVRMELARRGFPGDDRDFRAHLTLARVRSKEGLGELVTFLKRHGPDELGTMRVDEVVLFRSRLGPHGPTYDALARAPLEA